jgi:hypothetical protein
MEKIREEVQTLKEETGYHSKMKVLPLTTNTCL